MNTTIKELADIGAKAAAATNRGNYQMAIDPRSFNWQDSAPMREAFAAAVAEKVREEQQTAIDCLQQTITDLRAELAKRDERLTKLEWRDVSVKPTREDADEQCRLHVQFTSGFYARKAYSDWPWIGCNVASYRPFCPPPAPSPEEIERREFEEFYNSYTVTKDPKGFAFDVWQAARATKEETP